MDMTGARVAMVSMHTSPTATAGTGDAGGMNVLLLSTASRLAARGVLVDLLTRAVGEPRVSGLSEGVTLHELSAGGRGPLPKNGLVAVSDEFGEQVADLAGRRGSAYDVIHAHYWLSGIATLPVALELGIPFVQSFHTLAAMKNETLAPSQEPEPEIRARSEMYLAGQARAIVAGSAAEATALIDGVRAPADRIWVVPPGVDTDLFRPDRASAADSVRSGLGIAPSRPLVVVAGRVQPLKGQDLAVRALAAMPPLRGAAPVLVIAGETTPGDDGYLRALRESAVELGVDTDVRFVGGLDRESLADLLASAQVTLVPSWSETFGLVAVESAASGTPVIGYRGTGLVESVADGRSGLLLDSRDPRVWGSALAGLLDDPAALGTLSISARDHAEGYTWGSTATALLGLYASLR
jgi:D-inositol-3-phosphate glycosyltransferase